MVDCEYTGPEIPAMNLNMYVQEEDRSGRLTVNMWAWISVGNPGVMCALEGRLNIEVYIDILERVMVHSVTAAFPNRNFIFQQDNCPVHTSHQVATWFEHNNINVLD